VLPIQSSAISQAAPSPYVQQNAFCARATAPFMPCTVDEWLDLNARTNVKCADTFRTVEFVACHGQKIDTASCRAPDSTFLGEFWSEIAYKFHVPFPRGLPTDRAPGQVTYAFRLRPYLTYYCPAQLRDV
jgi:hypothetical protein